MPTPLPAPAIDLFVSDMDSTMIAQECIDEMARLLDEKRGTGAQYFESVKAITRAAMVEGLDFTASLTRRIAMLAEAGFEEAWLPQIMARIEPMPHAAELLAHLRAHGVVCVLVSGGFTFFADQVGAQLGFDAVYANRLCFAQGRLVGVEGPTLPDGTQGGILDGATKQVITAMIATSKQIPPTRIAAIGDGSNDAAMVAAAGFGIAYRGHNPVLLAAASHRTEWLNEVPEMVAEAARHGA